MGVSATRSVKYILKGATGDSAVNYYITLSASTFASDNTGKPLSANDRIAVAAYKQVGSNSAVLLDSSNGDNWEIEADLYTSESESSTYISVSNSHPDIMAPSVAFKEIRVTFSVSIGGYTQVYQQETILPLKQGNQGSVGATLRGPQAWSDCAIGYSFQAGGQGDSWKDVTLYSENYYSCIKSHIKTATNYPGSTEDSNMHYWQLGDNIELIATKILLASYALVKNLGVETIDMRDNGGNILFQAKDGNVTCQTGTFNNINISGTVHSQLFYSATKQITTQSYTINPLTEPYNWYVVANPSVSHEITLPQASLYDGLEINIITIMDSAHYNISYRTVIIPAYQEYMQIKNENYYNLMSGETVAATLENLDELFISTTNYMTMSPNYPYRFKSINSMWYALNGVWTGE